MTVVVNLGVRFFLNGVEVTAEDLWRYPTSSATLSLTNHLQADTPHLDNSYDFGTSTSRDSVTIGARLETTRVAVHPTNFFSGDIAHVIIHTLAVDDACVQQIHDGHLSPAISAALASTVQQHDTSSESGGTGTASSGTSSSTALSRRRATSLSVGTSSIESGSGTASSGTTSSTAISRRRATSLSVGTSSGRGRRAQTLEAATGIHTEACEPSPCQQGETCSFDTEFCSVVCTDIDECESAPCSNSAPCVNAVPASSTGILYGCQCTTGWAGENCQDVADLCADLCQHSGVCSQDGAAVSCDCTGTGFEGQTCELDVDDCAASPCSHGGICQDQVNAFQCQCANGYAGDLCTICAEGWMCSVNSEGNCDGSCEAPVDCDGSWSEWSACSEDCGGGTRARQFSVTTVAAHGGDACAVVDRSEDSAECNAEDCPVDCSGEWSDFSDCSLECGGGVQSRTYSVLTAADHGGRAGTCAATDGSTSMRACNTNECAVNCRGGWGSWTECSESCGGGSRTKQYSITTTAAHGGSVCRVADQSVETADCNVSPCPFDCEGSWSAWGACSDICGAGTRERMYTVTTEAAYGGSADTCDVGDGATDVEACTINPCPESCVGSWSEWSACSEDCGGGTRARQFSVTTAAAHGGDACAVVDRSEDSAECNAEDCPVDCSGEWSDFSDCSLECGGGSRSREYSVTVYAAHGGQASTCEASDGSSETEDCNAEPCPQDCTGAWSDFTDCTIECGGGSRSRQFSVTVHAAHGGQASTCEASDGSSETEDCNIQSCAVLTDCVGEWGHWTECSESCGGGLLSRSYRVVTTAANGGSSATCAATDESSETEDCNAEPCPQDCTGAWTSWSNCSVSCGSGVRSRDFEVQQDAAHGGAACPQSTTEACNTDACSAQDCLGNWSEYIACSESCGGGVRSRTYTVHVADSYGGGPCDAGNGEVFSQACNSHPCEINCVGSWGRYDNCSAECGGGVRTRTFEITTASAHGGVACAESAQAVHAIACNVQDCSAPVDCFGEFGEWSECSVPCAGGERSRVFQVVVAAANGGAAATCDYVDDAVETEACNAEPCPVDCEGSWSAFTACTLSCGGGSRQRDFFVTQSAAHGGHELTCNASHGSAEIESCNEENCAVDCSGDWGDWSTCDATDCGQSWQSRSYTITTTASSGGATCNTSSGSVESQPCTFVPCRVSAGFRLHGHVTVDQFQRALEYQTASEVHVIAVTYDVNASVILPFNPDAWNQSPDKRLQFRHGVAQTFDANIDLVNILDITTSRRRLEEDASLQIDYSVQTENASVAVNDGYTDILSANINNAGTAIAPLDASDLIVSDPVVDSDLIFELITDEESSVESEESAMLLLSNSSELEQTFLAQLGVAIRMVEIDRVHPNSDCAVARVCPPGTVCDDSASDCTCSLLGNANAWDCDLADQCAGVVCENSGFCVDEWLGYACICAAGYTGRECDENINECRSLPCQNGGACYDRDDGFNCSCPLTHNGVLCERRKDVCDPSPCENGGTCTAQNMSSDIIVDISVAMCVCTSEYTGRTCGTSKSGWWSVDRSALLNWSVLLSNLLVVMFLVGLFVFLLKVRTRGADYVVDAPVAAAALDPVYTGCVYSIRNTIRLLGSIIPAVFITVMFGLADSEFFSYYGVSDGATDKPELQFYNDMQAFFDIRVYLVCFIYLQLTMSLILDSDKLRVTWAFEFPILLLMYSLVSTLWLFTCRNFESSDTLLAGRVDCFTGYYVWLFYVLGLAIMFIGRCFHLTGRTQGVAMKVAAITISVIAIDRLLLLYFRFAFEPALHSGSGITLIAVTSLGPWLAGIFFSAVLGKAWPTEMSEDRQRPLGMALFIIVTFCEFSIPPPPPETGSPRAIIVSLENAVYKDYYARSGLGVPEHSHALPVAGLEHLGTPSSLSTL